ncbi:larval cuticle protein 65Ag1-like [Eurosta solidaginis]|uniref:larval cuticle protein 65Ag1-like n=1 Tax=Eurosta solidaginis TaxID=178769 RepID=UPI003530F953
MKSAIIFACLFAVAFARPNNDVQVVNFDSKADPESYSYKLDTSDGTHHDETGHLEHAGTEQEAIVVQGSFSFVAGDGQKYTVKYIADENGFQPQGDHLPNGV